jgi:hypothetical protein
MSGWAYWDDYEYRNFDPPEHHEHRGRKPWVSKNGNTVYVDVDQNDEVIISRREG